ncbi:MAG: response regulator [Phycisphaerae bacterium]
MSHVEGKDTGSTKGNGPQRRVLVVEPDRLTRWSIKEYLGSRSDVTSADGASAAHSLLDENWYDAVVIADDLQDDAADAVEEHARSRNPQVVAVRTVTRVADDSVRAVSRAVFLEKPFELTSLGRVLGLEKG